MAELGQFDKIEDLGQEALEIAEAVENAYTLSINHTFLGMAYLRHGNVKAALEHLEKGYSISLSSNVKFVQCYAAGALGQAYLLNNEAPQALSVLNEGTKDGSLYGGVWTVHSLTALADAYRVTGEINLAKETIARALKLANESKERGFESWAMLVKARINADENRLQGSLRWYRHAQKQATHLSMRPLIAHCHQGISDLYMRKGDKKEAKLEFDRANDMYHELGMTHYMHSQRIN